MDNTISIDFSRQTGTVKPLHGVNNAPMRIPERQSWRWQEWNSPMPSSRSNAPPAPSTASPPANPRAHAMAASSKSAFSLVELLVAVAVAAVVGGTALALILQAFDVWERGLAQTGELRAADAFDLDFARDFASACPALGFQGSADGCVFWTLLPDGGEGALARVRYAFDADGAVAERWSFGEDLEAPGRATRYRTHAFSSFAYGGTNVADDVWLPLWDSPTNMPRAVTLGRVAPPAPPMRRLYLRRTAP